MGSRKFSGKLKQSNIYSWLNLKSSFHVEWQICGLQHSRRLMQLHWMGLTLCAEWTVDTAAGRMASSIEDFMGRKNLLSCTEIVLTYAYIYTVSTGLNSIFRTRVLQPVSTTRMSGTGTVFVPVKALKIPFIYPLSEAVSRVYFYWFCKIWQKIQILFSKAVSGPWV